MSSSTDTVHVFRPAQLGLAAEADDVRRAAQAAGYAAGWAEGRRAAAVEAAAEAERVRGAEVAARTQARLRAEAAVAAAVADWTRRTTPVLDDLADLVVDSTLALAEAVLGRELSAVAARDRARAALRRALAPLPPGEPVVLRLHPDDLLALDDAGPRQEGHAVDLVADSSLTPGDAVAEQGGASVDARVSSALARAMTVARG